MLLSIKQAAAFKEANPCIKMLQKTVFSWVRPMEPRAGTSEGGKAYVLCPHSQTHAPLKTGSTLRRLPEVGGKFS